MGAGSPSEEAGTALRILGLGRHLPGRPIAREELVGAAAASRGSPLLRAPERRHKVDRSDRAARMVVSAAVPMFDCLDGDPGGSVAAIFTNVLLPDIPITGCGAEVAARLGCAPEWIVDLHNGGCASFVYMLKLAGSLLEEGGGGALICNVQNTAGQVYSQPGIHDTPQAALPGDGCGVALVARAGDDEGGAEVLAVETLNDPSSAADMGLSLEDGRRYWEPGESEASISFDHAKAGEIVERGNRLVPELVRGVCARAGVEVADIDALVTNQPNRLFLRNWHEALGIEASRHLDTFDRHGNLYGAGVPITLATAATEGLIHDGDLVVLAGFAHAGDFTAAAALRWGSGPGLS